MSIFVTSDTHFCHDKDFIVQQRGFSSIGEHNLKIIKNWNSVVAPDDEVYHLGDVYMGSNEGEALGLFAILNGKIHLIRGNHDTDNKVAKLLTLPNVVSVLYSDVIKFGKHRFYVSHYPAIVGDARCGMPKTISLHGHTHHNDKFEFIECCCYNVNLDAHNLTPVNIETIRPEVYREMLERKLIK